MSCSASYALTTCMSHRTNALTPICLRPDHMRRLYELSQAPNKIFKPLPNGDHNSSVLEDGYFEAIADFISSATQDYPTTPPEKSRV